MANLNCEDNKQHSIVRPEPRESERHDVLMSQSGGICLPIPHKALEQRVSHSLADNVEASIVRLGYELAYRGARE